VTGTLQVPPSRTTCGLRSLHPACASQRQGLSMPLSTWSGHCREILSRSDFDLTIRLAYKHKYVLLCLAVGAEGCGRDRAKLISFLRARAWHPWVLVVMCSSCLKCGRAIRDYLTGTF
jgi:hypothetical protein